MKTNVVYVLTAIDFYCAEYHVEVYSALDDAKAVFQDWVRETIADLQAMKSYDESEVKSIDDVYWCCGGKMYAIELRMIG